MASQSSGRYWLLKNEVHMELLTEHTMRAAKVGAIDAQQLANIAYRAACCGRGKWMGPLFAGSTEMVKQCVDNLNPHELAETAWAFATARNVDVQLFVLLAKAAEHCMGDFIAHDLADTA
eukprot:gnl/MRDRNA2_/MRDRNA2_75103_c0_seq2.p2 gnl/MRDRNA2_/MRDRNA2_75103_c0~~gnl/MRDRNA2_/MRDRNA2_75103_c0_seq2.p2  ORF type:complete len:139 (+),score=25.34 gnl/MRDRNA2_/MRDRNA2_75103_c0_seq2:59-418(+)